MAHTATTITATVWVADCQAVLVTSENWVGSICTHQNINKWSYNKPFRDPAISFWRPGDTIAQTRARRRAALKAADYGLKVLIYNTPAAAVADLKNGIEWEYLRPRGGDYGETWRLEDFDMYDHDTQPWFKLEVSGQASGATGDVIHFAMENMDLSWLWENMSSFSNLNKTMTYVGIFLIPQSGQSMFYRICPIEDFTDNKQLNLPITSALPLGKYKAVPGVVQYQTAPTGSASLTPELQAIGGENFPGKWIPLPTTSVPQSGGSGSTDTGSFEVSNVSQNDPTKYLSVELASGSVQWTENYDGSWTGQITSSVKISYSASALRSPLSGYLEYPGAGSNGSPITKSFSVAKGSSVTVNMGTITLNSVTEPKEPDQATVEYELSVKLDGVTYRKTGYIRIG